MKTTFDITPVPETRFGYDVINNICNEVKKIGCSRVLLIVDQQMKSEGLTQKIEKLLLDEFLETKIHIIEELIVSLTSIENALANLDMDQFDIIIGYGGWRCTDLAKLLSILTTNKCRKDDFKEGILNITNRGIPIISITTTPPNGAEIDNKLLIRDDDSKLLIPVDHSFLAPRLTIIDPTLMTTLPRDLTASTGLDALIHGIEALISIDASPFSEILALQAIALINENLVDAFRHPDNLRARYNVALGSFYSALALNNTGSGAVHGLAYPLTGKYGISHPQASALMGLHIMKYNLPVVPAQFVRIAHLMGQPITGAESEATLAIKAVEALYKNLDQPSALSAYQIPGIDINELADTAMKYESNIKRNPRIMSQTEICQIYRDAM